MKPIRKKLDLIEKLSTEEKNSIETQSENLKQIAGAEIVIDGIEQETVQVSVRNINGKRTRKYELFDYTYKVFSENLPEQFRVVIKV